MIKTALSEKHLRMMGSAGESAVAGGIGGTRALLHHLSAKSAKNDPIKDPDDPDLNERAAKAYKKKRNRSAIGAVVGLAAGHALTKNQPAEIRHAGKAGASALGSYIGSKLLSKKDRDDTAKYRFHNMVRNQGLMHHGMFEYAKKDEPSELDVSYDHYKKRRSYTARLKKGKRYNELNNGNKYTEITGEKI